MSPRPIFWITATGLIGSAKRYSPAWRLRASPLHHSAARNVNSSRDDAGVDQPPSDLGRAGALRDLDERLGRVVSLVRLADAAPQRSSPTSTPPPTTSDEDDDEDESERMLSRMTSGS